MKVKALIKALASVDPELDCYVEADHGQTPEQCSGVTVHYNQDSVNLYDIEAVYPLSLSIAELGDWLLTPDE